MTNINSTVLPLGCVKVAMKKKKQTNQKKHQTTANTNTVYFVSQQFHMEENCA